MTQEQAGTSAACIVHGCGGPAEVEVGWSARTCAALGWEPVARMRRYCRPCFDSKKMLHPWDSADEIKAVARA